MKNSFFKIMSWLGIGKDLKNNNLKLCKKIENHLKRKLTKNEKRYIVKWNTEFRYDYEVIVYTFKKTTINKNPNFDYIDKIISVWNEKGFRDVKEIEQYIQSLKRRQ